MCPECGAPIEPDQPYCLECGAPTPAAVPLRKRGASVPIIIAALLALAVGGGALIWALTKEDKTAQTPTDTLTALTTDAPPFTTEDTNTVFPPFTDSTSTENTFDTTGTETTGTFDTTGTQTTGTETTGTEDTNPFDTTETTTPTETTTGTTTTGTTGTTTGTTDGSDAWTGGDAYTVILSSVTQRSAADRFAARVNATGRTAGVLVSDNYSSLRAGFYVVFTGVYSSAATAQSAARSLRASYPGAYAAHIAG